MTKNIVSWFINLAEVLLPRLGFIILLILIGILIRKASSLTDPKKKQRFKEGYSCVERNFRIQAILPACMFIFTAMFTISYILASADGYMDDHPEFRYPVLAVIVMTALTGIIFIYVTRSIRTFYNRTELIHQRPFLGEEFIEIREVEKIVFVQKTSRTNITIHTLSNGRIIFDANDIGFEEFLTFAYKFWPNKIEYEGSEISGGI